MLDIWLEYQSANIFEEYVVLEKEFRTIQSDYDIRDLSVN